ADWIAARIARAVQLRRQWLQLDEVSDAWRVVHSEGDDLSGLIVDRYANVIVIEYFAAGMWRFREAIHAALLTHFPGAQLYRFAELAKGRRVLDLCCNAGGFAVHAMACGAREAVGVDLDAGILEVARANAEANQVAVTFEQSDIFDWVRAAVARGEKYDAVILDPAKLTRDRSKVMDALKKY